MAFRAFRRTLLMPALGRGRFPGFPGCGLCFALGLGQALLKSCVPARCHGLAEHPAERARVQRLERVQLGLVLARRLRQAVLLDLLPGQARGCRVMSALMPRCSAQNWQARDTATGMFSPAAS